MKLSLLFLMLLDNNNLTNNSTCNYLRYVDNCFYLFQVRQNYIKRRLLTTYKALERLSKSEFNLDQLEIQVGSEIEQQNTIITSNNHLKVPGIPSATKPIISPGSVIKVVKAENPRNKNFPVTLRDVERDRGKPLSKYERNMMIFNWLHTLDDTSYEGLQ